MAEQLAKLAEMAQRRLVTVKILPLELGAHPGLQGPFVIATLKDDPDMVYRDMLGEGQVIGDPDFVAMVADLWESLNADALPQRASIELVRSWAERWKTAS